jgi:hypothetical protein
MNLSVRELEMAYFREIVDRCKYSLVADSVEMTTKGMTTYEATINFDDKHRLRLISDNPFNSLELEMIIEEETAKGWAMRMRKSLDIGFTEAPTRIADTIARLVY